MAASMRNVACVIQRKLFKYSSSFRITQWQCVRTAKKVGGAKIGATVQKVELQVEEDPEKLCNFLCGGNISTEGKDPELKPDTEYPEWLWSLRTDRTPDLTEQDTEDFGYWRRLRKKALRHNNKLMKVKKIK